MELAKIKAEIESRLEGRAAEYFANTMEQNVYVEMADRDGVDSVLVKIDRDCRFDLVDYETGERVREATLEEAEESIEAASLDGGAGVIEVDGRRCYVI